MQAVVVRPVQSQSKITKQSLEKYENTQRKHMSVKVVSLMITEKWIPKYWRHSVEATPPLHNSPTRCISYAVKSYETNEWTTIFYITSTLAYEWHIKILIKRYEESLMNYVNNTFIKCFITRMFLPILAGFSFEWFRCWSIDQAGVVSQPRSWFIILRIACVSFRANGEFHGLLHRFAANGIRRP